MGKQTGFIIEKNGKLYVRVTYTDSLGKKRELMRRANDRKHARHLQKELVKKLDSSDGCAEIEAEKISFAYLAERYAEMKLIPAQYIGNRKVAGLRSVKSPKIYLKRLVEHFGKARIRAITYSQVDEYRMKRLSTGLKIASVNRELTLLRSIFIFAKREGWLTRAPFEMGSSLISLTDETKRDRVLSRDEETKLLLTFSDNREHLRPVVIAAIDTGCRKGELLALTWHDVDFVRGVIKIRAMTTKTLTERTVPMSDRLRDELQSLQCEQSNPQKNQTKKKADNLVFNAGGLRSGFEKACRLAGIADLRFHDLRATFCTRLIEAGMPIEQVAKLSGHTQLSTLYTHYLSTTRETIQKAADLLNKMNGANQSEKDADASHCANAQRSAPGYIN